MDDDTASLDSQVTWLDTELALWIALGMAVVAGVAWLVDYATRDLKDMLP